MKITQGFTLLELLAVMAVLGILLSLAIPSYQTFMTNHRTRTLSDQLVTAIQFARNEAIKRHTTVTLCASHNGQTCGNTWAQGWLVFVDQQNAGQVLANDLVLRAYGPIPVGAQLTWQATRSNRYLQLSPTGSTRGQAGRFVYCAMTNTHVRARVILVSQTGRVRTTEENLCG